MNGATGSIGAIALGCALAFSLSAGAAERTAPAKPGAVKVAVSGAPSADATLVSDGAALAPAKPVAVGCAPKVKVVYAGYGEADRAACVQPPAIR